MNRPVAILITLSLLAPAAARSEALDLVAGHLYGPGPLPDQATPTGLLSHLQKEEGFMAFHIAPFNNEGEEPNLPGEAFQGKAVDGIMSDGTVMNEHADVGYVSLMKDQLKLLLAAVYGGPNQGRVDFFLDENWNWTIHDDIAIDPGFGVGVIHIDDFRWSTGPRILPLSTQTARGYPAGVDRAGSKSSGQYIPGKVGDDDFDGFADGVFNAVGSFPLDAAFLPGAPFSQTRTFVSDVRVTPLEAAILTLANGRSHLLAAAQLEAARTFAADAPEWTAGARERLEMARRQLRRAIAGGAPAAPLQAADATAAEIADELGRGAGPESRERHLERLADTIQTLLGLRGEGKS